MGFVLNRIVIVTTFLCTLVCVYLSFTVPTEYDYLWILPSTYFLLYLFIYRVILKNKMLKITVILMVILSFIRCVIIPLLISLSIFTTPHYDGRRYIYISPESIRFATVLTAFEIIIASIFLLLLCLRNKNSISKNEKKWEFKGNKTIYSLFISLAVLLYLLIGYKENVVSFFAISLNNDGNTNIDNSFLILVRQIIVVAIIISFLWIVSYCKQQYDLKQNKKYVNIALFFALLNVSVIVGDRRSVQIYTAILSIWLLINIFQKYKKKIVTLILGVATSVILLITFYRMGAFRYGSYMTAIKSSNFDLTSLTNSFIAYFGGPDSIATGIEFANQYNLNYSNLLFDFGRTIFGLNFLLENQMYITSQLYNMFLYGNQLTGQVIYSTAYGYMYFGILGTPFIVCLNIWIASIFERLLRKSISYEMVYLCGYCLLRISFNLYANTPTIVSIVTLQLGTLGLLLLVSQLFNSMNTRTKNRLLKNKIYFEG